MKIVMPNRLVVAESGGQTVRYRPYCRYVVSDYEAVWLLQRTPNTHWEVSSANAWVRPYGGQDLAGKTVLLYRHTAYGDQLMISAVPKYLMTLHPQATVHLWCDPGMSDMWLGNMFVGGSSVPIPIPFDVLRNYDYHIFYEGMLENNGEPDQNCCYDDFFGVIGMRDVPDCYKRPMIVPIAADYEWTKSAKLNLRRRHVVYHLCPANLNRAYPLDRGMAVVEALSSDPDLDVYVVGKDPHSPERPFEVPKRPNVINLLDRTPTVRALIPLIETASCVVCPDSAILHLAACFDHVPTVSLWGPFDPQDRAKYYPNDYPIFEHGVCKFAACRNHEFTLPLDDCTKATNWVDGQKYCAVLSAVPPERIVLKVMEVMT